MRVNESNIEDREPSAFPPPPEQRSGGRPRPHKVEGKAQRINDNSVDDQKPTRSSGPRHSE
ncbi:hypothetical protein [Mesorhizobium sp. 131-2-1]|uniref:hypothetical protein n=1 Tax=Mesorhizobium sp. 131-2-1 TaxID=2744518 RepID=UPI001925596B|nr:hypothetical protein [Mesorhizobium sp. 131-2-1]BCG96719.1 hypothetical protein MesoLj131a_55830 [Mesorhizobium sp. 131-2-1]